MFRVAARRIVGVTALVIGAVLVVSVLGGNASGALRAQKAAFAPLGPKASQLSIGLRVTPRTATRGKTVTYLLRLSNTGDASARLVRVCYQIPGVPPRLILVSAPPGFVRGGGGLVCRRFASLPVGGTLIFKFRMQVPTSARGGVIISHAYARSSGMVSFISATTPLTVGVPVGCFQSC
ncbi:MAG TPA: hypothetical protein VLD16_03900 [Gaiellaceae bacterium]|nr:hypothetical protein [Gaiellaceae bacterium]